MFDDCYFLIPARKGSKGFPFKNRKLFEYTAVTIPRDLRHKVFVSTNDEDIKEQARGYEFNVIDRPEYLAEDISSLKDVMLHFIRTEKPPKDSKIILLFLTYPERTWFDIKNIYNFFLNKQATSLICAEKVKEHPYLSFYEKEHNKAKLVVDHKMFRRQDYPDCIRQSMFFSCYQVDVVNKLHDLLFEKDTVFYKLKDHKIDVDYMEDYIMTTADERFMPRDFSISFQPFMRHFERYFQCVKLVNSTGDGQKWLDCACGTGYGTNFLTNFAQSVVGYDIDRNAIRYANQNYKNKNCEFTNDIENYKETFDVILSVETIEHMPTEKARAFLNTLRESLKKDGIMVITTPIVTKTNHNPINKFHDIEYSDIDFVELLKEQGFQILDSNFIKTTFTDGETKDQGYYKCRRLS